ncbi:hypothetical protein GCK32_003998 [Trichostrongylus colubriformis]|uniref:Secreted protein n=1 Tax=Trichostrongylus colubriformis TaxID=6319 RepID=A0AAN8F5F3_TRICO
MVIVKMMLMVLLCFLVPLGEAATDRLDDVVKLVFGYTLAQLQAPGADLDKALTGYNIVQQQYMRTLEWMATDDGNDNHERVKAFYEMVLQWLEELVENKKNRDRIKNEMTHEWKKMPDELKEKMKWRFIGFQVINEMAGA